MNRKPKVSVVIPNYNGMAYLEKCIDSLMRQTVKTFEILVMDDASTDGSIEALQKKYPANNTFPLIRYSKCLKNRGFCATVNDGIEYARGEYVILLNNDTEAEPGFVEALYREIRKKENTFSVAAAMLSMQDPTVMDDAGDYYCALGWAYASAKDKPACNYDKRYRIFSACGGAAIYRRDLLKKLGGFDVRHFAYLEDVDIGWRAKLAGYENRYTPKAVVKHAGSASTGSRHNPFKVKITARNNIYLIRKNMAPWQIVVNFPLLVAGHLIKLLFFAKKGFAKDYLAGVKEGFAMCKGVMARKRRVDFRKVPLLRQIRIEAELLGNILKIVFSY